MSSDPGKRGTGQETSGGSTAEDPISKQLRQAYRNVGSEPLSPELEALLERLKQASRR